MDEDDLAKIAGLSEAQKIEFRVSHVCWVWVRFWVGSGSVWGRVGIRFGKGIPLKILEANVVV